MALDAIAEGAAPDILAALIERAMTGDPVAAQAVLSRAWPARKGRATPLPLPAGADAERPDLAAMARAIAASMADGVMTPEEAASAAAALAASAKVIEAVELERRVAALEEQAHVDP